MLPNNFSVIDATVINESMKTVFLSVPLFLKKQHYDSSRKHEFPIRYSKNSPSTLL